MNQYPPHGEDPRYPNPKHPYNLQPSWGNTEWGNSGWGDQQGQPPANDPYRPTGGNDQYRNYGQPGRSGPPSQQQSDRGQYDDQGQYGQYGQYGQTGQYGPQSGYGQSQQGWGYGASDPQSQQGAYGQYGQYGTPSQHSPYGSYGQYGQYGAPQSPYGYPAPSQQDPDYEYEDPPRKSRKGLYTILSISGVIIVIMVACGVLTNDPHTASTPPASIAGTWYGRADVADGSGTLATEAFMDIQQAGTSLTGGGKLCVNRNNKAFEYVDIRIDGTMTGNNAAITWHTDNLTNGVKGDHELTGTLTKGTLSLIYQDGGSNVTLGAKKGTRQEYLAACRQLPGS